MAVGSFDDRKSLTSSRNFSSSVNSESLFIILMHEMET